MLYTALHAKMVDLHDMSRPWSTILCIFFMGNSWNSTIRLGQSWSYNRSNFMRRCPAFDVSPTTKYSLNVKTRHASCPLCGKETGVRVPFQHDIPVWMVLGQWCSIRIPKPSTLKSWQGIKGAHLDRTTLSEAHLISSCVSLEAAWSPFRQASKIAPSECKQLRWTVICNFSDFKAFKWPSFQATFCKSYSILHWDSNKMSSMFSWCENKDTAQGHLDEHNGMLHQTTKELV